MDLLEFLFRMLASMSLVAFLILDIVIAYNVTTSYESSKKTLVIGEGKMLVEITKDYIMVEGRHLAIGDIQDLLTPYIRKIRTNEEKSYPISIVDVTYKIGCSNFTLADIKLVLDTHESLKK
jgi:hypothetical protein